MGTIHGQTKDRSWPRLSDAFLADQQASLASIVDRWFGGGGMSNGSIVPMDDDGLKLGEDGGLLNQRCLLCRISYILTYVGRNDWHVKSRPRKHRYDERTIRITDERDE